MLDYYRQQSTFTDPGKSAYVFDDLPRDRLLLKELIHGLILHFWDGPALGYSIPIHRLSEVHMRYVSRQLEVLISRDSRPLYFPRTYENRVLGSCRDFALLFCSILRHQGIPARIRVAFSRYYLKDFHHDQVILEYWSEKNRCFCRVDPRITPSYIQKQKIQIDFDLFDVPHNQLMLAGEVWLLARKKPEIANTFGGGNREKNKGLWYIRDRLIQDLAALNRVEMQLWDVWGKMHMPCESLTDKNELFYFDELARLSLNPEKNREKLMQLFQEAPS